MKAGTVAMLDALGFKGIWRRPEIQADPGVVTRKLQALAAESERAMDQAFGNTERRTTLQSDPSNVLEFVGATFLSDTIVVGVSVKPIDNLGHLHRDNPETRLSLGAAARALALLLTCRITSRIIALASASEPTLAYRGAIADGQFELEGRFLLGPAVDEAADNVDRAQGAFVSMAPTAAELFSRIGLGLDENGRQSCILYDVPLKGGDSYRTFVVSPYEGAASEAEREAIASRILHTFGSGSVPLDVAVKRQQTEAFLNACLGAARATPKQEGARAPSSRAT